MVEVSVTKFLDFVHKSGLPRMTCLKDIKKQYGIDYAVERDYYKWVREKIIEVIKNGLPVNDLNKILNLTHKQDKIRNYRQCIEGFSTFANKHTLEWCGTDRGEWIHNGLAIIVNPELLVKVDGKKYMIKLYFKTDPISKARSECIFYLFETAMKKSKNYTPAILNCRTSSLIQKTKTVPDIQVLLQAEADAFLTMWNSL